jgi:hypothetical protein
MVLISLSLEPDGKVHQRTDAPSGYFPFVTFAKASTTFW